MAKKRSRRARRRRARKVVVAPEAVSTLTEERKVRADESGRGTAIDLAEQYGYVYGDLKRIAMLAGTMFAILILLSFVIR